MRETLGRRGWCETPQKRKREAGFGRSEVCRETKVSHIEWRQQWHRTIDLYGEGQGGQGGEVAEDGSMQCRVSG